LLNLILGRYQEVVYWIQYCRFVWSKKKRFYKRYKNRRFIVFSIIPFQN